MFSPMMSIQEKDVDSATYAMIETQIAAKSYNNNYDRMIKKLQ